MEALMGIDIGSTSIKAVIFDPDGNRLAKGSASTPLSYPDPNHPAWCVWESEKVWAHTAAAIRQALSQAASAKILGVAVTGFGMDGLPVDKDGCALYPLISWHCPRTAPQMEKWNKKIGKYELFAKTGKQAMAIDSVYRMMWINENHPGLLRNTDKWLLIGDFINFRLCGSRTTDYSMACTTSLFDPVHCRWSAELIRLAGIPEGIFPEPLPGGTVIGGVTRAASKDTGLKERTPVIQGGHDYICAAFAAGAVDNSVLLDVAGTWEMTVLASEQIEFNRELFESGYYIESHVAKGRCCFAGSAVSADMLEWFVKAYGSGEISEGREKNTPAWDAVMQQAISAPAGANGCFFLPHFSGAGAPHIDNRSMGAFLGLSNSVGRADSIRAIIEGLNYQFREMVEALEDALSLKTESIRAVGGTVRNAFWMQNKADILGKVIEVPETDDATALGAALLAGLGSGLYRNEAEAIARTYRPGRSYEPDLKAFESYSGLYEDIYRKLYPALRAINGSIFDRFKA